MSRRKVVVFHAIYLDDLHQWVLCIHGYETNHKGREEMAKKTVALEWNEFFKGKVVEKEAYQTPKSSVAIRAAAIAIVAIAISHQFVGAEPASTMTTVPIEAVAVVANTTVGPDFSSATKPIKDIIFGAAHEIYFVFMAWGALEAMIGQAQSGFNRMKVATGAYILLFWVPWIVDQVNKVRPATGY